MLLLTWAMSKLWTYLLLQVRKHFSHYLFLYLSILFIIYTVYTQHLPLLLQWVNNGTEEKCTTVYFTGAKVNIKDQGLLTPLHRAAASQNEVCSHFETEKKIVFSALEPLRFKSLTFIFWNLCFSSESCGAVTKAQSRGQHTGQVLAHAITHGSCEVGYRVRFSSDTSCVQPGCCWQIRKDPIASCSIQWPQRGTL